WPECTKVANRVCLAGYLTALMFCLTTDPAAADITVLMCGFGNAARIYFTLYDDGTPVRIGIGPGVGNRGLLFRDPRNKTIVIVEQNTDGVPDTFTTITGDMN